MILQQLDKGGNVDVALAMAQTARRGMPDSSNAADTLGWAYFRRASINPPSTCSRNRCGLTKSTARRTIQPSTIIWLSLIKKVNQPAQARQQLERALKINPNYADARKALSELRG